MPCFREEISFVNKAKFSLCSGLLKENLNEIDGVEIKWNESSYFFAAPKVGRIRSATQGAFIVIDVGEDSGDTSKLEKNVRVVTRIEFYLKD